MFELADFAAAGLFLAPNFLEPEVCRRLIEDANRSNMFEAKVSSTNREGRVDRARQTLQAVVPSSKELIDTRLDEVLPDLVRHFGESLICQGDAQMLVYRPGDYFRPHRDVGTDGPARQRRASVVLFLNGQSDSPRDGAFCGGGLMFFRVVPDPDRAWAELRAQEGLLVAFPSDVLHEVRPVTYGNRYSAVAWFLSPS